MPKIITFATLKGGAGKTMNLFNIAGVLGEKKKVLLIDDDPQCNLTSNCGVSASDTDIPTIYDVFLNYIAERRASAEHVVYKAPMEELPNIDLIPSSIQMFEIEERIFGRYKILKSFFENNADFLSSYDYILIDTNPSMGVFNINAFYVADAIILSTDVSVNSVRGVELFCGLWDHKRQKINEQADALEDQKQDNIEAIIISNYRKNTTMGRDMEAYLKTQPFSKDILLKSIITSSMKLKDTEVYHRPITKLAPKHPLSDSYRSCVQELKKRKIL